MGREAAGMRKNAWRGQVGETLEGSAPAQEDNGVDQRLGASPCPQLDTSAFREVSFKNYTSENLTGSKSLCRMYKKELIRPATHPRDWGRLSS